MEKSCTAPMNTTPSPIHSSDGSQPNCWQARMGPAIGPAAAMAEKCWPQQVERPGGHEVDAVVVALRRA